MALTLTGNIRIGGTVTLGCDGKTGSSQLFTLIGTYATGRYTSNSVTRQWVKWITGTAS